jgi:hypothetical protein
MISHPYRYPARVTDRADELTPRHVLYALVGGGLLLVMGVLVFSSGLVAPPWATVVLVAAWAMCVVMAVRSWRRYMFAPIGWGVAIGVLWIALLAFGDAVLGWSA